MNTLKSMLAAGAIVFALPALAQDLVISEAYVLALPGVENAAALYMVIKNNGKALDTLVGATCEAAGATDLLATVSDNKGAPRMLPQPEGWVVAPAGGFNLAPGGYQVALLDLKSPLQVGDKVSITLKFAAGGEIPVEAVVR